MPASDGVNRLSAPIHDSGIAVLIDALHANARWDTSGITRLTTKQP
jgi:hypothetical protein